jgi:hypothetical protein
MFLSSHSPELRELSSTDLKFLEEGLDGQTNAFCDLDTILDDFQADHHILLTNPDQLLNSNSQNNGSNGPTSKLLQHRQRGRRRSSNTATVLPDSTTSITTLSPPKSILHSALTQQYLRISPVDGCEPGAPPQTNSSSHHQHQQNTNTSQTVSPSQSVTNGVNGSGGQQNGGPTTTLLQNILQQNRTAANGNIYSLQRQPQMATTTTTSPLPPSPADSGVSDVDSHYSSNDEQQHQQMSQYGYFYGAQRQTYASSQAPASGPAQAGLVSGQEVSQHTSHHYHPSHRHIYSLESPTTTSSPPQPTASSTTAQHLHTSHPHLSATLTNAANIANQTQGGQPAGGGGQPVSTTPRIKLENGGHQANFYNNHYTTPDHKGMSKPNETHGFTN